ncbi:MAG: TonB-dependent receptor, partial [Pigmentiphaga sp.]
KERSFFGNVTAHITPDTEVSAGIRRIRFNSYGALSIGGVPVAAAAEDKVYHATIYQASASHRLNRNVMAYASFGSSWRPGSSTNAVIQRNNLEPTPVQAALLFPDPEKSKSYELGLKTDWFNDRLRFNITGYHQTFKNFGYFAPNIAFASVTANGPQTEVLRGIATGVPAKVDGVEAEIGFRATRNWSLGAVLAYARSKVRNGTVPCNDYFPADGVPDTSSQVPSYDEIMEATDGAGVALCQVNNRAGTSAPFSATVQSEYNIPLGDFGDGYLRGLVIYNGKSLNDPNNPYDDIKAYALVNLFAGLRDPDGAWEIGIYGKNLFDVERALARNSTSFALTVRSPRAANVNTPYRGVTYTAPREFGITAKVSFGSR